MTTNNRGNTKKVSETEEKNLIENIRKFQAANQKYLLSSSAPQVGPSVIITMSNTVG